MKEILFKRKFREKLNLANIWSDAFESSFGTTIGCPDLAVQFAPLETSGWVVRPIIFLELKVGEFVAGELVVSDIRPAQYAWHRNFLKFGGIVLTVVGVGDKNNWKAVVMKNFTQERFLQFCGNKRVGKHEHTDWPSYNCSQSDYHALSRWARIINS